MESRAKLFGHPIHEILVPLPIGAFGVSSVFDALHSLGGHRSHASAARVAIQSGLVAGLVAAPFGFVDWLAIDKASRAKPIGLAHALANLAMLGAFLRSNSLRRHGRAPASAKWTSALAISLGACAAWLGGELIVRHGIGVNSVASKG
jgi:uncharacterized membrane protein